MNNKYNFINVLAHEYKHVLDAVDVGNLLDRGFNIHDARRFSPPELEFRAIDYQRCHSSYESVDSRWIRNTDSYQNLNRRRYNELLKN
jgi:hypothetical protein